MNDQSKKHDAPLNSLIETVINGEASADDHHKLEQRLLADEQARDTWLNYVNLHASLSGWFLACDSAEPLENEIADLPLLMSREQMQKSSTRRSYFGWTSAIVACLLVVGGVYLWPSLRSLIQPPNAQGPTILQLVGDFHIQSTDGRSSDAQERATIGLGETITSSSDLNRIKLQYADGTEIVLLGASSLTVADSTGDGKLLLLTKGLLQADVAPQPAHKPLLIVTPQARLRVLGTRFELATDEQDGTRLDLESGQVELVRGDDKPLKVEPNFIAIVPTTPDPIRVSPRPAIVDTPLREIEFRGLKTVAFTKDGESLIGGTRWQALYWYDDERLEVVPFSNRGSDGISLRQQANSHMAYFDHQERELVIWDASSRQPQFAFEHNGRLKKQFRKTGERPPNWNPASQLALVSPQADWLAFQVGREFRIWQVEKNHWPDFVKNYDGRFVGALAASPDGQTLAVAVRRGRLDLVDVATGETITTWSLRQKVPFAMEFSADGQYLAVGLAGHVSVHRVDTGELLSSFEEPGLPFLKVAISSDGRFVAASSLGERVWLWDVAGNTELPLLDIGGPIQHLEFAPQSDRLAVLSRGGRLTVWDVAEHKSETRISKSEITLK